MRRPTRDGTMAAGFVIASFALAFAQRPGWATSDTKIDLHVDPGSFLGQVASMWTHSIDLGAVASTQYAGYLWPMGPIFAFLHGIGLGAWVSQRIWLGLIFAVSAWGVLRLMDAFVGRPRGAAHVVAAGFYVLNPYTVIFTGRTSLALLGYAALPWLLLIIHRGVREPRGWTGWWWAAAFALILTSVGGGINGAVVGWMLVGPLALLIYEPLIRNVAWRDCWAFVWRMGALGLLASLWWIVPLALGSRYGIDFLQFTEQPRSIWGTNSAPEALRLMGYWTSYIGVGFYGVNRPLFSEAGTLLFNPLVVGASLLLPALAIAGFIWTRRWRYGPFLLFVLLVGVTIELAAFPSGTPSREAMEWVYRNVPLVRFMRTTQKAAPLVAIGVAGLLGLAARAAWASWRGRLPRAALAVGLAGLIALAALPLVRGTAIEKQLTWKRIPAAWTDVGRDLDRKPKPNSRALVLPGQIFANYTWGGTTDAILPRVTKRPVAVRYETPYGDPRATDLLWTVDRLVSQGRLLPGQLLPLVRLMGAGAIVTGSDDDTSASGAVNAAQAAAELDGQGLRPVQTYGPTRAIAPARGELGAPRELPEVRRYDVGDVRGIVHVDASGPPTIVDGGAEGLAGLAAFGALPDRSPILYAGDLSKGQLRSAAARGAEVVVSDSNRRRRFVPEFARQNLGATLPANEPLDPNQAIIEPFPDRGTDAQTVAVLQGAAYVRAPNAGGLLEFPERDAIKALDGDPRTVWSADRYYHPRSRWIEIGFDKPRDVDVVELLPLRDSRGQVTEVDINGKRAKVHNGWNAIPVNLEHVSKLRITLVGVRQPQDTDLRGNGGLREIRIAGLQVRHALRPPVLSAQALGGRDLSHVALNYLFERTTADDPYRRDRQTGSPLLELAKNRTDAEEQIERVVFAPGARSYDVSAWVNPSVDAADSALDRLAGWRGPERFDSSGRYHDLPRHRASRAFDGDPDSSWLGIWARPAAAYPWISWTTAKPTTVRRLRLAPPVENARRPTAVRLDWAGGHRSARLPVAADGTVAPPPGVRGTHFRLTVLDAAFPPGTPSRERASRAVGIGELEVNGVAPVSMPTSGPLDARCGAARIEAGGHSVALRPSGTVEDLDAGRPLRASGCGGRVEMGAGIQYIRSLPADFSVDLLRLRSPAPAALPPPRGGGTVTDPGEIGNSSVDGAKVSLSGPSWLVLGQAYSEGWQADCDGRDLGKPRPIDGYANGWRAPADCKDVSFTYGPQRAAKVGYAVSAVVCAALLAFLLLGLRRRAPRPFGGPPMLPALRAPRRLALPRAALLAAVITVPLALLFAKRTSVVIFPLLTLILWRGVGARLLTAGAALAIGVAVPLLYLIENPTNRGGYNFEYSLQTLNAHWVTEGALVLLMVACWRTISSARAPRAAPAPPAPPAAQPAGAAPVRSGAP